MDYAAPVRDITATLTVAGWTGDAAPYTQTVTGLAGVTAASKLEIGLAETATDEEYEASVNAKLRAVSSGSGSVTVKAHSVKPAVNIPILIRVVS